MGRRVKISIIAALCVSPSHRRVRLYVWCFAGTNIDNELTEAFLEHLLEELPGPVTLLWDRLGAHVAEDTQDFLDEQARLEAVFFPPYSPELNPVERLWRWLKWGHLANFAPEDVHALMTKAEGLLKQACMSERLLRGFIKQSELPLELNGQMRH